MRFQGALEGYRKTIGSFENGGEYQTYTAIDLYLIES
jgi:hypothetical protein